MANNETDIIWDNDEDIIWDGAETPSRDAVIADLPKIEDEVARGIDPQDAKRGVVGAYINSSGNADAQAVSANTEAFGAGLIGKKGADINTTFQAIQTETDIGDAEQVVQDILENSEWIMGEDGVVLTQELTIEQKVAEQERFEGAPESRFIDAYARSILPEGTHEWMGITQKTAFTKGDFAGDILGGITGELTAFFSGMRALKAVGGVRAIPKVGQGLQALAKTSPRAAMMTEQALSTFAVFGAKSQLHSSSTDLKERAKMLGVDAIVSSAFPVATELALSTKLGKAALPASLTAMFGAGTVGEDTFEGKMIGGTSLMMMWAITHGMSYRQSKKVAIDVAKASGQKNPEEWVNGLKRTDIMRGARLIDEKLYMNNLMKATASRAKAKADAGQKLLPSEHVAMAKANEGAVVAQVRAGEIAPIKADRAVLQSRAILKGVMDGKLIEQTTPIEDRSLDHDEMVRQGEVVMKLSGGDPDKAMEIIKTISPELHNDMIIEKERTGELATVEGIVTKLQQHHGYDVHDFGRLMNEMAGTDAVAKMGQKRPQPPVAEQQGAPVDTQTLIEEPLPPEVVKEQGEMKLLQDAHMFNMSEEETIRQLMQVPSDEGNANLFELERLSNLPPETPVDDLTTPAGNEFIENTAHKMQRGAEAVAGFFRRFGRQYVSEPALAQQFEDSYHNIAAAPHLGVLDVHKKLQQFPRTAKQDRMDLAFALEADNIESVPLRLRPIYKEIEQLFKQAEQMQIDAGVLGQTFEESHAMRLADLDRQIAKVGGAKKQELTEERRRLQEIKSYLPHNIVARRVLEDKLTNSNVGVRRSAQKKLSQFHKARKGTHSLKEYVEAGVITENDADVVKLLMSTYADTYHKIAVRGLIEWGKAHGQIVPIDQKVDNPHEWNEEGALHPVARVGGLDNMKMSRLFAQGLEEISGKGSSPYNWWDKVLGITKVGQFMNPSVIYKHNASQAVLGGSATANPKTIIEAGKVITQKGDLWREFEEGGLYQKTDIPTRRSIDDLIQIYSNKTKLYAGSEATSRFANVASQLLGISPEEASELAKDPKIGKIINDVMMSVPNAVSQLTWIGDELQRTISALTLMKKGYSAKDAAQEAGRIHGAYSNVGIGYKDFSRRWAFVYSFRLLMPWEYQIKPYITLAKEAHKKAHGKPMDEKKAKAAGWKLMATMLIPAAFDAVMKQNGWEVDEKERESTMGKFIKNTSFEVPMGGDKTFDLGVLPHWRYKKDIETIDGTKTMHWVVGTPNMTLSRLGIRSTENMPEELGNQAAKGIFNAVWAETHPMYKTMVNFFNNDPLTYGGEPPRGVRGDEYVRGLGRVFLNTFKIYGAMAELEKAGELPPDEAKQQLKDNLNILEKGMSWFGFQYVSNTDDRKRISEIFRAKANVKAMGRTINNAKTLTDKEKKERTQDLIEFGTESIKRIFGDD